MKNLFLLLLISASIFVNAQISFEPGYIINNQNQKIEVLIKNKDWKYNPTSIEYKANADATIEIAKIADLKSFEINETLRYERYTIDLDMSDRRLIYLDHSPNPQYEKKQVWLKVLIDGKASLYEHESLRSNQFFYQLRGQEIKHLIYKQYRIKESLISTNETYKNTLWTQLKCDKITKKQVENLKYRRSDIVQYVTQYNHCNEDIQSNFIQKRNKNFSLTVRPRVNYSNLTSYNNILKISDLEFDSSTTLSIGMQAEYTLPYNKNKWAVFLEASYEYYKSEVESKEIFERVRKYNVDLDYKAVHFSAGVRHYLYLNRDSKFFINGAYDLNTPINSSLKMNSREGSLIKEFEFDPNQHYTLGIGYKFKDKYSAEIQYQTTKTISNSKMLWDLDYKVISVILGYTIF